MHSKNSYRCCLYRRQRDKTSNRYSFCNSSITCKINNNKERIYYIGKAHSKDCTKVTNINKHNLSYNENVNNIKNLKDEFKLKVKYYLYNTNKSPFQFKINKRILYVYILSI